MPQKKNNPAGSGMPGGGGGSASAGSGAGTKSNPVGRPPQRLIHVTFFGNQRAQNLVADDLTLEKIAQFVRGTHAPTKGKLPWLKLAKFGSKRTDKNCLRHDANVQAISGIEGDYDGKIIPLDAAIKTTKAAGIKALLYSTASYTDPAPKWRILCPTSRALPPGERAKLVARVNGLFGGVLDPASFNLSQAYYFGYVGNRKPHWHRAEIVDGDLSMSVPTSMLGR
jgi:hypothetical protein